jgi:hypothetical protein
MCSNVGRMLTQNIIHKDLLLEGKTYLPNKAMVNTINWSNDFYNPRTYKHCHHCGSLPLVSLKDFVYNFIKFIRTLNLMLKQ